MNSEAREILRVFRGMPINEEMDIDNKLQKHMEPVSPVKHTVINGDKYNYGYSYTEIHIDEVEDKHQVEFPDGTTVRHLGLALLYQYGSTSPILITNERPYRLSHSNQREAERNAYFCLNILNSVGLVSDWRQE